MLDVRNKFEFRVIILKPTCLSTVYPLFFYNHLALDNSLTLHQFCIDFPIELEVPWCMLYTHNYRVQHTLILGGISWDIGLIAISR